MYRTPMRRGLSPDSPVRYRDSPHSRQRRSWSRGHSPSRHGRSPDRRGRSRSRSRTGGHTRSKSRGRPARSRSKSRGRPARSRSKSRGRPARSRSRSRPRRSPSPYPKYRRRSPGDSCPYESRGDQNRLSPSDRSNPADDRRPPDRQPLSSSNDSSGAIKPFGHESSMPLPMPKKSILKKRTDVEPVSRDQSPQVDNLSANSVVRSVSSAGTENNNLSAQSQQEVQMGLLTSSGFSSSSPAVAQTPESPLPQGSAQSTAAPTGWALSGSMEADMKANMTGQTPPCEQTDSPKVSLYSSSVGNLPLSSLNLFPQHKDGAQQGTGQAAGGFLLPHEPDCKSSLPHSKTLDPKQRSSAEIEDEELFLYGDEEDKKPEPQKAPPVPPTPATPANSSENKQEFEKIHDLLKTIGLDIGVAEIGKLAVRTQERLHGKRLVPKMSQPAAEKPQSVATARPADPKGKNAEPPVKTEKEEEPEANTKAPVKAAVKELTPLVTLPSPAPVPKEKPQLILRKAFPKETTAAPKVEIPVQPPPVQPPTVHPPPVQLPPVQPPPVHPPPMQPPTISLEPTPPPISPSQMPIYSPYSHSPMVPRYNMPPPNYNPYSPYVSYPTSSWTMYSPMPSPAHMSAPHMSVAVSTAAHMSSQLPPPPMSAPVSAPTPVYNPRSNLRVIETTEDLSEAKADVKPDANPTNPLAALLAKQEADRKNKEAEKLKVLEELECIRKEHKVKKESLATLSAKVDQLRIQQGILLRKKRREKDGHKDPLLEELNKVLESAQKQINSLCEELNSTKLKQRQLTKVAEILGFNRSDLAEKSQPKKEKSPGSPAPARNSDNESRTSDSSKSSSDLKLSSDPVSKADVKDKSVSKSGDDAQPVGAAHLSSKSEDAKCKGTPPSPDPKRDPEPRSPSLSKSEDALKPRDKSRSKSPRPCTPSTKTLTKPEEPPPFDISEIFEYYDSGSHWCEDCNAICMTLPEFLLHLHERKHNQCVKEVKRPWVKKKVQEPGTTKKQKVNIPLKGSEFLVPVNGYYCRLCEELFPDHVEAEEHLRAYAHNDKYKKHTDAHINYEVLRRERKKTSLMAAQEAARRQAEQKRKLAEQKHEAHEYSRSKRAKKEQEEERKAKTKHHTSASSSSDKRRNKTPEKEPPKNPSFGKFVWKTVENKTPTAVGASKVDAAPNKPKEEESKTVSLKPKGFAIKLMGSKPSTLPGNALSPSHSSAPTTVTVHTTSTTSAASSSPTTSNVQTKVRPDLPSVMSVRPPTPVVTMSKPAPLNTFLSIRASNATSKSIPVVKNKAAGLLSEDPVSKTFGGDVALRKGSTQQEDTGKPAQKEKVEGPNPKPVQKIKQDLLFNVVTPEKETVRKQEVKSEIESPVSKKPLFSYAHKSGAIPTSTSQTTCSGPTKSVQGPQSNVQQTPSTKSPAPLPVSSTAPVTPSISSSTNSSFVNAKTERKGSPSNQQTGKAELTPKKEESAGQQPQEAKTPTKLEKETSKEAKASTFSMNPMTGRLEYLPVQECNVKNTNVQKPPPTTPIPAPVSYISSVKPIKPVFTPLAPSKDITKPTFNATTRLNQKFKKAPLSLPSSLFGYVQDAGCKDIKITSIDSQKTSNSSVKPEGPLLSPAQKKASPRSSANPSSMQQELESYYKLIATEEDPEDLTTSEDQDSEAATSAVSSFRSPLQTKVESPSEKKVKLDSAPPMNAPNRPVIADVSGEDMDDSDMACEVPDVSVSSVYQTSGWNFMQSSYASIRGHGSWQPSSLSSGNYSVIKDQSKETQVTPAAPLENSMEDLSVYVTCDSD
ncbi:zinc finger protein 318 [Dendropsophus ebraccatus]|uniref:zinc finger protein 318 n=1 Tax=Dendropsophus ebraccatus TaxID=150705 RepID=UPI0038322B30